MTKEQFSETLINLILEARGEGVTAKDIYDTLRRISDRMVSYADKS